MPSIRLPTAKPGTRAGTAGGNATQAERERYVRDRDLPRLLPLWPGEIEDGTLAGRLRLLSLLRRALRAERQRGIGGQWSYDLAPHRMLLAAYRVEAQRALSLSAEVDQQRGS